MFSKTEQKLFLKNLEDLQKISSTISDEIIKPTREDKLKIMEIITQYIKDNNMIVYGGNAQNLAVKRIDPKGCFYDENEIKDFDTYSSSPVQDAINICNLIYKAGYKNVLAQEAIHVETYTIKYGNLGLCDLSYVPKYILDNLNTYTVDGFRIIDPYFAYIDFMRVFSDPLVSSSFRWEKHFDRFNIMQQYYPLEPKYSKIESNKNNEINKEIKDIIKEELKKSDTLISVGLDCYNKYVELTLKPEDKIPLNYYTLITSNYLIDTQYIYDLLKKKYKNRITKKEKYPFFQFWDFSCEIYLDDELIIKIFGNNNICIQYKELKGIKYASFTTNLMWLMIENVYYKMFNKDCSGSPSPENKIKINSIYFKLLQNMLFMKVKYLKEHKKTILDDTFFQHFVLTCSGVPIDPTEQRKKIRNYIGFKYVPSKVMLKELPKIYSNISGRFINPKNEKIDDL